MTDDYFSYKFSYISKDSDIEVTLNETDENCLSWPQILSKFIRFLEMTHNYEIMHKIQLKYSPFIDPEMDWQGKFFDVPEDKDEDEQVDDKAGLTE